jgi:hypothetical protein
MLYRAYDHLDQMVNLVAIDSKFDFGKENELFHPNSYLSKIIIDEPTIYLIIVMLGIKPIIIHKKKLI